MTEADIEGSKSHVDMNSWRPQASYPCGNFSDTSSVIVSHLQADTNVRSLPKGSISRGFPAPSLTGTRGQSSFLLLHLQRVSVSLELNFGHTR